MEKYKKSSSISSIIVDICRFLVIEVGSRARKTSELTPSFTAREFKFSTFGNHSARYLMLTGVFCWFSYIFSVIFCYFARKFKLGTSLTAAIDCATTYLIRLAATWKFRIENSTSIWGFHRAKIQTSQAVTNSQSTARKSL